MRDVAGGRLIVMPDRSLQRFMSLPDVAETLDISLSQVQALVRRGDLVAVKIGGRGQWRVETTELESYIQRLYAQARERIGERQPESHHGAD
jgi:excisionase family DNA binding protein